MPSNDATNIVTEGDLVYTNRRNCFPITINNCQNKLKSFSFMHNYVNQPFQLDKLLQTKSNFKPKKNFPTLNFLNTITSQYNIINPGKVPESIPLIHLLLK